jgi:hypothetical protein
LLNIEASELERTIIVIPEAGGLTVAKADKGCSGKGSSVQIVSARKATFPLSPLNKRVI